MLTRPGAGPGCGWMKRIVARIPKASQEREVPRRWWKLFWLFYAILMVAWFLVAFPLMRASYPAAGSVKSYESSARIAGLPLVKVGPAPHAIIAIGGRPVGVVAIGGLAVGVVAVGGVGVGLIGFGGLSAGIFALGGAAIGWWAMGGAAAGFNALAGFAVGGYAYAGHGVALGYYEASGNQKERLFG